MPRVNTQEDFWKSYIVNDNGCWVWNKSKSPRGYGKTFWHNKDMRAHRLAFYFKNGSFPKMVCHKCDNPSCINPDHLFAGDHKTNMRDMKVKGRAAKPKGEIHPANKYTEKQILEIRDKYSRGERICDLSREYKMAKSYIKQIVLRQRWRHI